jgi:hypothetical protein
MHITVKNKKLRANDHGLWNPFSFNHALMTMALTKRACSSKQEDMLNYKHMPNAHGHQERLSSFYVRF